MRGMPVLAGILSQVQRRQTYDNGQYTVAPIVMSYSESYYISYGSTTIVTITETVPCEVWTSYTTLTTSDCPEHCPDERTTCYPKSCTECSDGSTVILPTPYNADDTADAIITSAGVVLTTTIPANQCTVTAAFNENGDPAGLPTCGGDEPDITAVCIASPCLVTMVITSGTISVITSISPNPTGADETIFITVTLGVPITTTSTGTTTYNSDQQALVTANPPLETPGSLCAVFTSPEDGNFGVAATGQCGDGGGGGNEDDGQGGGGGGDTGGGADTCGVSVVTYTYMSSGATIVEATTLPGRCITFSGVGGRKMTASLRLVVWLWYAVAILSGIGMIVL